MALELWFAQKINNIKWPEISKGHNSNKNFMKLVEQEDHDGPISRTWPNRFAYLLLKFQPSSLH